MASVQCLPSVFGRLVVVRASGCGVGCATWPEGVCMCVWYLAKATTDSGWAVWCVHTSLPFCPVDMCFTLSLNGQSSVCVCTTALCYFCTFSWWRSPPAHAAVLHYLHTFSDQGGHSYVQATPQCFASSTLTLGEGASHVWGNAVGACSSILSYPLD